MQTQRLSFAESRRVSAPSCSDHLRTLYPGSGKSEYTFGVVRVVADGAASLTATSNMFQKAPQLGGRTDDAPLRGPSNR